MTGQEYCDAVARGKFPDDPVVPVDNIHTSASGDILNLVFHRDDETRPSGVEIVQSKKWSLRSNHYHKTDWHYMYVLDGEVVYFWRKARLNGEAPPPLQFRKFGKGEMMFTPPLVEHATLFTEETRLLVVSRYVRDSASHEADLVRVKLLSLDTGAWGVPKLIVDESARP
jgi:oxalate decarboxylase/phosphoglucose isomerase-like protein (cupin superfamily)